MLFKSVAQEYTEVCLYNKRTIDHVLCIANIFINRAGVIYCDDVNLKTLMRFKRETLRNAKPITLNGYLKYLRLIGDYGVAQGYIESNPFKLLPLAPIGVIPPKTLELNLINELNEELRTETAKHQTGWFWSVVIECFYYTGMRRRQLVNLKIEDLDFTKNTIRLSYEGSKTYREWIIPMLPQLRSSLLHLIAKTQRILKRKLNATDYIFRAGDLFPKYAVDDEGRMKPESVTGYFRRQGKKKNIAVGAHRFRHTVATELCNPEDTHPDIFAVQELLGHSDISTTRIYVNTRLSSICRTLDQLNPLHPKNKM